MADRGAKVLFKFRSTASPDSRASLLRELAGNGGSARPLFPDDSDDDLADVFVVESDGGSPDRLIKLLEKADSVEYAELEPVRRAL